MGATAPAALTFAALALAACASEPPPASPALTVSETTEPATVPSTATAATTAATTAPTTAPTPPSTSATAIASPPSAAPTTLDPDAVLPEGFDRVRATVTKADGTVCELCLWLAESPEQRAQGLMFVTDLGGADGMAFLYDTPQTGAFWMKNTVLPLSIAFYAGTGDYLGAFDMEPCTADPCPTYPTSPDFTVAVETTQGNLDALGIEPGSALELTRLPCG